MSSLFPGYEYDIFISYRQKDNKYDGWVTEFVDNLKRELEATFKEDVSVYFDINPHDGLLETHDVDASLKEKLRCLVIIPIISRTYCDPKSFAWEHEFKAFIDQASQDQYGLKVKLAGGNIASRVLPIQIHDLNPDDKILLEKELGGYLRAIEFIYKEPGVNRPLKPDDDDRINLTKTKYRNQINKVANAIDEIFSSLKNLPTATLQEKPEKGEPMTDVRAEEKMVSLEGPVKLPGKKMLAGGIVFAILFIIAAVIVWPEIFRNDQFKDIRDAEGRISVAVMPFKNMTGDSLYNKWQDSFQNLLISSLSNTNELSVRSFETMLDIIGSTGHSNYASITPVVAKEIALKLESGTVILGSLSQAGSNFRINVQLMKAESSEIYKAFTLDFKEEAKFMFMADSLSGLLKDFLRIEVMKQEDMAEFNEFVYTNSPEAYLSFVQALKMVFNNNNRAAGEYFSKAIKIDSNFTSCYYFLALGYQQLGNFQKAETNFIKAEEGRDKLSIRDQQFYDHLKYGYLEKNPQKAIEILYQLAEKEPQNRFILNNIGDLNRLMHNYDKEIEAYEKYVEIDTKWGVTSKWIWPYVELGDAYHIMGNHKREAELYIEALQMIPDYPAIISRQARCALSLGDSIKAGGFIKKYVSLSVNIPEAQLKSSLGTLYSQAGILDKAELYYRKALNLDPKNPVRMNIFGLFLIKNNINIEEGMELIDQALGLRPDNYNFLYTKGLGLLKQGHYTKALDLLEKSWAQRPDYDYDHYQAIQEAKKAAAGQN